MKNSREIALETALIKIKNRLITNGISRMVQKAILRDIRHLLEVLEMVDADKKLVDACHIADEAGV